VHDVLGDTVKKARNHMGGDASRSCCEFYSKGNLSVVANGFSS
jgi:hypothetical protein